MMKTVTKAENVEVVKTRGFTLSDIPKVVIVLGFGGIILGVTLYVMEETDTSLCGTYQFNASGNNVWSCSTGGSNYSHEGLVGGIKGVGKIGDFFSIIGISVAIAIVIGVLYFAFARYM